MPPSGFHSLRAPSPVVRTRLDPPPQLPQIPEKRRRGRPRNCDRRRGSSCLRPHGHRRRLGRLWLLKCQLGGRQPHVLKIDVGEDVVSRILEVSQINGKAVCVLSVLGAVQEANLLHSSSVILNHKGPLEIVRMFGSIFTPDAPGFGCLSVTLACADCSVVGGIVAGPLIAATPVQATVGSFYNDAFWPNKTPKIIAHYPNSQVPLVTESHITPILGFPFVMAATITLILKLLLAMEVHITPILKLPFALGAHINPILMLPLAMGSLITPILRLLWVMGVCITLSFRLTLHDGSTNHTNSHLTIGDGSTNDTNSYVTVRDGGIHNPVSQVTVVDGSVHNPVSQVTVGDGNTHYPNYKVSEGKGSSHYPNSKITVGDRSTPFVEGFNPECASCTAMEQDGSSEIDVKPSHVVA